MTWKTFAKDYLYVLRRQPHDLLKIQRDAVSRIPPPLAILIMHPAAPNKLLSTSVMLGYFRLNKSERLNLTILVAFISAETTSIKSIVVLLLYGKR
ncbi:MAG: hypothetical protein WA347_02635 [Rhabdochlamydiaceae bacterium]